MQSISSREFNQDVGKAKRAAEKEPVFITDRGTPAHVLLTVDQYYKLIHSSKSVADLLAMPDCAEIEFEPVRDADSTLREVDLS
ncbi:type II toxin-antitoxin system Phd/YefM family antitoxin [Acaryochloris marina]|uniref:type II toxin-antitoxin system Phd/YefM family antitoxin n=1 Tax=Acaryochloris marina TaxID=155978 RepID=UPI0021C345D0|nr:type II toxin-antitoxin system Phd/YefM family antitoxin [Acaryochloris marina]BDM83750.1 antitoxin [Acaryochloris marina MBIC10699]